MTLNGSENGQGYCLPRAGKITGLTLAYKMDTGSLSGATAIGMILINGASTAKIETVGQQFSAGYNDTHVVYMPASYSFSAGDAVNVKIRVRNAGSAGPYTIEDIAALVEILL